MTPELFQNIEEIFDAAKRLQAERRGVFLDAACAGQRELRQQVEELLLNESQVTFLDEPALANGTHVIAEEEPEQWVGKTINGRYRVLEKLGEGGMGEVYLVEDHYCRWALKILPRQLRGVTDQVGRFVREAHACASIRHPNIANVIDYGQSEEGTDYVVMEFVDGQTLRQRLREGPIAVQNAIEIAFQIASALSDVHDNGILHRDLKPDNIMLVSDENNNLKVKLIDFGLGKVLTEPSLPRSSTQSAGMHSTQTGIVMGSPGYMSPEQIRGQELDAGTDLWSLGVILYEMVAGRRPFDSEVSGDEFASILLLPPKPISHLDLPQGLEALLTRCLSQDKGLRYRSADEFEEDLKKIYRCALNPAA